MTLLQSIASRIVHSTLEHCERVIVETHQHQLSGLATPQAARAHGALLVIYAELEEAERKLGGPSRFDAAGPR